MNWQPPHISKIYEALTAIADNRMELSEDKRTAKCFSSSKGKFYEIEYDKETRSIMSNDNTAFFKGEISYPMIAMLMLLGELPYTVELANYFINIPWKDLLQKHKKKGKNDYDAGVAEVLATLSEKEIDITPIKTEVEKIHKIALDLKLERLGKMRFPPKGY